MAVSGLPETCENHAKWIAKLALGMMDMAKNVAMGSAPLVNKLFFDNINDALTKIFMKFSANYYWHPLRRSCDWCYWESNATILLIWEYC